MSRLLSRLLKPVAATLWIILMVGCGDSSSSVADAVAVEAPSAEPAALSETKAEVEAVAVAQPDDSAIDLAAGEQTYGRFCFSCHAAGVAGAPKLGDAEAWAPRVAKGLDALVASSIAGIPPGMPARGLCSNCSDQEMRNTIAWMIAQ